MKINHRKWLPSFVLLVIAGVSVLYLMRTFSSMEAMSRFAAGERLVPVDSRKDLGSVSPGKKFKISYSLKNFTKKNTKIIGSSSSCTCTLLQDELPVLIPQGGTSVVDVMMTTPKEPGDFGYGLTLLTDNSVGTRIDLSITGAVIKQ